jgi:hypothetical protein
MADTNKNITQQDVTDWLRSAPTEAVAAVLHPAIDRISSGPTEYRDRFTQQLSPQSRKMFQGEQV